MNNRVNSARGNCKSDCNQGYQQLINLAQHPSRMPQNSSPSFCCLEHRVAHSIQPPAPRVKREGGSWHNKHDMGIHFLRVPFVRVVPRETKETLQLGGSPISRHTHV